MSVPNSYAVSHQPFFDKLCIGLTGSIACGKSTVANLFADLGAGIIDTDAIAHQLTLANAAAIPDIRAAFGNEYIDEEGALNRRKMRHLVFSDTTAKRQLEDILHPLILQQTKMQLALMDASPYVIIVVPLLFSSPAFQQLVERTLVVDCKPEIQLTRLMARGNFSAAEAQNIIEQQTPRSERLKLADDVIDNDVDLGNLKHRVKVLHENYLANL